jgi:hypothetical protein
LKEIGKGVVVHYDEIPTDDMRKIVAVLNASNQTELQYLAWWYVQLFFCKRGRENTYEMKKSDLCIDEVNGKKIIRLRRIMGTKNHRELNEDASGGGRITEMAGDPKCPVKTIELYISKLHPINEWLWQKPICRLLSMNDACWYESRKLGKNILSNMMSTISSHCSLSKKFTNHCVRVSACTLLGDLGYSDLDIQSVSKHKSTDSLGLYKRVKENRKVEMATRMAESLGLNNSLLTPLEVDLDIVEAINNNQTYHNNCCLSIGSTNQPSSSAIVENMMPNRTDEILNIATETNLQIDDWNNIDVDNLMMQAAEKGEKMVQIKSFFTNCTFQKDVTINFNNK